MDALKKLASKAGIHLEQEPDDPKARAARKSRGRLLDLYRDVSRFFHEHLKTDPQCQHARDYLKSRGFGRETAERWEIGWMPDNPKIFLDWARERKYTGKELVDWGFAGLRDATKPSAGLYVRFRDRLMFPIRSETGDVIAFSGRQLKDDPRTGKYINSPETDIFKKSNVLFGLDMAKKAILKEKTVIICEGQIDAIACYESGVENAIASQGTAFTPQQARILKRYATTAALCYDADSAGIKASTRAFRELVAEGLSVKMVQLPAGDDPDTYLKAHGVEGFRKLVDEASGFFDFKIEGARAKGLLDSAEDRAQIARECTELLAAMGDHAARDQQINVVSSLLGLTSATLREGIGKSIKRTAIQAQRPVRGQDVDEEVIVAPTPLDRTVGYLCHLALGSAPAQHFLSEQFETLHEAKAWVEGVGLLEKILAASPDPGSSAAVNAFIAGLRKGEQLALNRQMGSDEAIPQDGLQAAEQSLGMLSSQVLQKRDAAVKAALKEPGIPPAKMKELLEEAKEIAGLLRWTGRSLYDDELPKETIKAEKKPWEKWKK